ncbi:hypothetical protein [Streptomyces sp. NRRL B-24484]|uniref:hypothetical protein n=1 Tax=Streptomyces sp. NRRL B-24484 TaxID=1463833 RepID=UPI0004C264D9|nr:hypothetical protein [Streptomyces sp. NRRL B-24484]
MTQQPTAPAGDDLRYIAHHWPTLRAALQVGTPRTWPPVMGIDRMDCDDDQAEETGSELAERTPLAPGERPAPLRVGVLDALSEISEELCTLADGLASAIQRPPFVVSSASARDYAAREIALATAAMAERDRTDPRRWQIRGRLRADGGTHRDGGLAALWLLARLDNPLGDGPFRRILPTEITRIRTAAAGIRRRIDRILGDLEQAEQQPTGIPCACGGELAITNNRDDDDFEVTCGSCGTRWSGEAIVAALLAA